MAIRTSIQSGNVELQPVAGNGSRVTNPDEPLRLTDLLAKLETASLTATEGRDELQHRPIFKLLAYVGYVKSLLSCSSSLTLIRLLIAVAAFIAALYYGAHQVQLAGIVKFRYYQLVPIIGVACSKRQGTFDRRWGHDAFSIAWALAPSLKTKNAETGVPRDSLETTIRQSQRPYTAEVDGLSLAVFHDTSNAKSLQKRRTVEGIIFVYIDPSMRDIPEVLDKKLLGKLYLHSAPKVLVHNGL